MAADVDRHLKRAREAKRESKNLDFKAQFDPAIEGEWIELIKDFAAMANSGGGVVVIGVANDGSGSGADIQPVLDLDGAKICDKLVRYVGENFDDFEVHEAERGTSAVAAIVVGPAREAPLVFGKPGNYTSEDAKQKTAFTRGTPYFRHGAKSEPATSADLRSFIERRLESIRKEWLGGINRVVTAPSGAEVVAIKRTADPEGEPTRIRITDDPDAPVYGPISRDETHPYRQTELVKEVNKRLPKGTRINDYDMLSVRRVHEIDAKTHPDFAYQPKFGSCQYSDAFVNWIVEQFEKDSRFFAKARERYYDLTHGN